MSMPCLSRETDRCGRIWAESTIKGKAAGSNRDARLSYLANFFRSGTIIGMKWHEMA